MNGKINLKYYYIINGIKIPLQVENISENDDEYIFRAIAPNDNYSFTNLVQKIERDDKNNIILIVSILIALLILIAIIILIIILKKRHDKKVNEEKQQLLDQATAENEENTDNSSKQNVHEEHLKAEKPINENSSEEDLENKKSDNKEE